MAAKPDTKQKTIFASAKTEDNNMYIIESEQDVIGRGKTCIVYKGKRVKNNNKEAEPSDTGETVAIGVLRDDVPTQPDNFTEGINRLRSDFTEIDDVLVPQCTAQINIKGKVCTIMDYMGGGDCGLLIDRFNGFETADLSKFKVGQYPREPNNFNSKKWLAVAYTIILKTLNAVSSIHNISNDETTYFHGDVIPTNILLGRHNSKDKTVNDKKREEDTFRTLENILNCDPAEIVVKLSDISLGYIGRPSQSILPQQRKSIIELLKDEPDKKRNPLRKYDKGYLPEPFYGELKIPVEHASDINLVGRVAIELLTGLLPSHFDQLTKGKNQESVLISQNDLIKEKVAKVIVSLLTPENTAEQYVKDLRSVIAESDNQYYSVDGSGKNIHVSRPYHRFMQYTLPRKEIVSNATSSLPSPQEVYSNEHLLEQVTQLKMAIDKAKEYLSGKQTVTDDTKEIINWDNLTEELDNAQKLLTSLKSKYRLSEENPLGFTLDELDKLYSENHTKEIDGKEQTSIEESYKELVSAYKLFFETYKQLLEKQKKSYETVKSSADKIASEVERKIEETDTSIEKADEIINWKPQQKNQ